MNIMALIPARGGSKGVPGKNKRILGDKPLIAWTIEDAIESGAFDRVIVSTEDKEISQISEEWGAEVVPRPPELAADTALLEDAVFYTEKKLAEKGYLPSYKAIMCPTSPFRRKGLVNDAMEMALSDPDVCYVHSLRPINYNLDDLVLPGGNPFMPTPIARELQNQTYCLSMNVCVERMIPGGQERRGVELLPDESIDIDMPADWDLAEKASIRWM